VIYRAFFDHVLVRFDAERSHSLARRTMRALAAIPGFCAVLDRLLRPREEALRVSAMGLEFRSPLGVAAGVDKDASWYRPLGALGFGFVEVGTVTAKAQPGKQDSDRRVSRLPADQALLNEMGFPNPGAGVFARRLQRPRHDLVVGVNVGKTKLAADQDTVADYRETVRTLAPLADYLVVNVSSPNTPGLVGWQDAGRVEELIGGVQEELAASAPSVPLLLKLGPDIPNQQLREVADVAVARGLAGIVAVNTSTDLNLAAASRAEIAAAPHRGGVSGRPLRERAIEVLDVLRDRVGDRLTLISVGGVETPEDIWHRILAGASLVQAHTAFVYEGPLWPSRINRGLSELLRASSWDTLQEAIGAGAPGPDRAPMASASPPAAPSVAASAVAE
jgi:dihydroorotate dehydrogenase